MKQTPMQRAQDALNEVTVYCRLLDAGMSNEMARKVSHWFGLMVNEYLYPDRTRTV